MLSNGLQSHICHCVLCCKLLLLLLWLLCMYKLMLLCLLCMLPLLCLLCLLCWMLCMLPLLPLLCMLCLLCQQGRHAPVQQGRALHAEVGQLAAALHNSHQGLVCQTAVTHAQHLQHMEVPLQSFILITMPIGTSYADQF